LGWLKCAKDNLGADIENSGIPGEIPPVHAIIRLKMRLPALYHPVGGIGSIFACPNH
jgi:hypothetical protein